MASAQRQIANLPGWKGKKQVIPPAPPFPNEIGYLYSLHNEYCIAMDQNGMGPAMATWTGLRDWNELMGYRLDRWELLAIARLTHVRAVIESEKMVAKNRKTASGSD